MSRYDDGSSDCARWTNKKLLREIRGYSNLEGFGSYFRDEPVSIGTQFDCGDFIRAETHIYRETWLKPLLDELESRLTA